MDYNLIVADHADEQIDKLVGYLIDRLKNPDAAMRFLDGLEKIYERLREHPLQFSACTDEFLRERGYHEALVPEMNYRVIFRIESQNVYIVGVFHALENYESKIQ